MDLTTVTPKKRIDAIDALRGFALMGILIMHCLEHFELYAYPKDSILPLQFLDRNINNVMSFFFSGKAYAMFSMLFGVSFFIQMENQADKGQDFRWRFAWRMILLLVLGMINSAFYSGEIFVVYAILGLFLIPFYKVPDKWLMFLWIFFLLKIPFLIRFGLMFFDADLSAMEPHPLRTMYRELLTETQVAYKTGTFWEVFSRNFWEANLQKCLWYLTSSTWMHIFGLFLMGMWFGKKQVHRNEDLMVKYAKKGFAYGLPLYVIGYCMAGIMGWFEFGEEATRFNRFLFNSYANLGMTFMVMGGFLLCYICLNARRVLNYLAPVGRMSLTNYMAQSIIGPLFFYQYGLGLSWKLGYFYSFLLALVWCALQIAISNWWMKRYYYGPVEWLWRGATWFNFRDLPFKRPHIPQ